MFFDESSKNIIIIKILPLTMAKKKPNNMFVRVLHPSNKKNIAKSVTVLKLCERSFKWDHAGCPSFIRLEMALEWRQVVRNLKIHYRIFMFLLCRNIETKRIELEIRSWRHFKENSKLFYLLMDIKSWFSGMSSERAIFEIFVRD